jgi:hypothetical protein
MIDTFQGRVLRHIASRVDAARTFLDAATSELVSLPSGPIAGARKLDRRAACCVLSMANERLSDRA